MAYEPCGRIKMVESTISTVSASINCPQANTTSTLSALMTGDMSCCCDVDGTTTSVWETIPLIQLEIGVVSTPSGAMSSNLVEVACTCNASMNIITDSQRRVLRVILCQEDSRRGIP